MNSGTISLLLFLIVFILLVSGWKEVFIKPFSSQVCILFMLSWLICRFTNFFLSPNVEMNLSIVVILAALPFWFRRINSNYRRIYVVTVTVLIGMVYALFGHLVLVDPILMWLSPNWDPALVMIVCVCIAVQLAWEQLFVISAGLLLGDILVQVLMPPSSLLQIGSSAWYDQWWFILVAVRLIAGLLELLTAGLKLTAGVMMERFKGWKR